ncbi:hypothetical protein D3C85_1575610 [compost metagenome]
MPLSLTPMRSLTLSPTCSSNWMLTVTSPRSVNLMALPTRLVSTCPSRSGSPTRLCGTAGLHSNNSSSPLSAAFCPTSDDTFSSTSSSRKLTVSSSMRSASTLEKSRMSLMMPSSEVPALWILLT